MLCPLLLSIYLPYFVQSSMQYVNHMHKKIVTKEINYMYSVGRTRILMGTKIDKRLAKKNLTRISMGNHHDHWLEQRALSRTLSVLAFLCSYPHFVDVIATYNCFQTDINTYDHMP